MYGPVPVPPRQRPPSGALVIVVRVVLVALTLLSLGMLAWVTMLRLAILRRRALDWVLFCVVLVLSVVLLATVGSFAEKDWRTEAAMAALLIMAAGVVAHYLVADIRHFQLLQARSAVSGGPYGPGQAPTGPYPMAGGGPQGPTAPGHGYSPAAGQVPPQPGFRSAFQPPPQQQRTPPPPSSVPSPYSRAEPYPQGTPQGTPPGQARPQRIERVRAELDELSDYLRREDGNDR